MNELENLQPEENVEKTETVEGVDGQALQDATHEPGARIEETQTFQQAENIEGAVKEALEGATEGTVDRNKPDTVDPSEFSDGSEDDDDDKDEATPINLPGPVTSLEPALSPDDVKQNVALSPDDVKLAAEPELEPQPEPNPGPPEAVAASGQDEIFATPIPLPDPPRDTLDDPSGIRDQNEVSATPIPLPDPPEPHDISVDPMLTPDDVKMPATDTRGGPGQPGGDVAATPINLPYTPDDQPLPGQGDEVQNLPVPLPGPSLSPDDVKMPATDTRGGPGQPGGDVAATPINLPYTPHDEDIAKDHPGPGGQVAQDPIVDPEPDFDRSSQLSESPEPGGGPDGPNLEPAPDFEDMNTSEQAVVELISKAIAEEDFRQTLLNDTPSALSGYAVAEAEQAALGEMQAESFDFFAAEVEARLNNIENVTPQALQQVVHSVWRDLNPGSLAYVLAYKIPAKHL